jgi:CubicO group peptidase (beta-lactamase class C family)
MEMTVEHLMNMNSGYDCDDRVTPPRPGNEDVMHRLNTDNYRHTLNLPMDSSPGEKTAYCSINPNLVGAVLSTATKRPLKDLFQDYIAEPLQMKRYYLLLQPTGEPYMGGGIQWLPREFLKLGQLMLNEGMWKGTRVISKEWARRASTPMVKVQTRTTSNCLPESTEKLCLRSYGYLWWHIDFPYKGRKVHAYYAGGNGGQSVVVIPEFDMVVETWAGNYASSVALRVREDIVERFVLPAIKD